MCFLFFYWLNGDINVWADNPLVPGIAHLYLQDEAKHAELAAEWTLRFAKWGLHRIHSDSTKYWIPATSADMFIEGCYVINCILWACHVMYLLNDNSHTHTKKMKSRMLVTYFSSYILYAPLKELIGHICIWSLTSSCLLIAWLRNWLVIDLYFF